LVSAASRSAGVNGQHQLLAGRRGPVDGQQHHVGLAHLVVVDVDDVVQARLDFRQAVQAEQAQGHQHHQQQAKARCQACADPEISDEVHWCVTRGLGVVRQVFRRRGVFLDGAAGGFQ
jgi:hypothetical protein